MQNKTDNQVYAGFFVRLAAYLIDSIIVGAALLLVRFPFTISSWVSPDNLFVRPFIFEFSFVDIVSYLLTVTYFILLTYKTGATVGKRLLHLKVVSAEEREVTLFEVIYRETVGRFLSGLIVNIGYFMIGLHREKRGLHDLMSDTKVVYEFKETIVVNAPVQQVVQPSPYLQTAYVPTPQAAPVVTKEHMKVYQQGLGKHAELLRKRILERIEEAKLEPIEIELSVNTSLGEAESYQISRWGDRWKIIGTDEAGLYYGIGKFLHTAKWTEHALVPVETEKLITPKCSFRAIYFAVHFYNWYQMAPIEELERYVEDLLLYGYNTIVCIIPVVNITTFEDELFVKSVEKTRAIYQLAKKYGMKIGFIVNPNQGVKSSPEEFDADLSFDPTGSVRPHFGKNLCQAKPGALEHMKFVWNSMLSQYKDIGLDYILTWPYDEGGCGCENCRPWGAKGYGDLVNHLHEEAVKIYPDAKFVVSTWLFDMPDDQGEYEGFYERLRGDLDWIDYIMVDNVAEFPRYPLEHEVVKPIVSFPEISMWKHWPWGGKGANPLPKRFQRLWNETKHILSGGMPYSEGMFEDILKVQCVGHYFEPDKSYRDILLEYINYEYSGECAMEILEILEALEECHVKLADKVEPDMEQVFNTAKKAEEVNTRLDERAKNAWRWRILFIRTQLDRILCETYLERDQGDVDGLRRIRNTANEYLDENEIAQEYLQELCSLYHCVSENGENRYTRPPVKDGIVK